MLIVEAVRVLCFVALAHIDTPEEFWGAGLEQPAQVFDERVNMAVGQYSMPKQAVYLQRTHSFALQARHLY